MLIANSIHLFVLFFLMSCSSKAMTTAQPKKLIGSVKVLKPTKRSPFSSELKLRYTPRLYRYWMNYFQKKQKARFIRHVNNGLKYKKIVSRILRNHGLPQDLFYVGLIESGYNTYIKSSANAVGPWQFIKGTAKRYGLRVDSRVDERSHIYKATHAAANYFKDLYNIFGSWELALCAYNSGEYKVIRAIRKGNTRDYLKLSQKRLLPKETVYYVAKVVAARALAKSSRGQGDGEFENAVPFRMKRSFKLKEIAGKSGVSLKTLKRLNPDLRRSRGGRIRVYRRGHLLYFPRQFKRNLAFIKSLNKKTKAKSIRGTKKAVRSYRVKSGDTLIGLTKKFKIPTHEIKSINKLRDSKIRIGQKLLLPFKRSKVYIVRKGDNLIKIARLFGISLAKLVKHNELKGKTIFPHQKIRIPLPLSI